MIHKDLVGGRGGEKWDGGAKWDASEQIQISQEPLNIWQYHLFLLNLVKTYSQAKYWTMLFSLPETILFFVREKKDEHFFSGKSTFFEI